MNETALDVEGELPPEETAAGAFDVSGGRRLWLVPAPVKVLQVITGYLLVRWLFWLASRHLLGLASECRIRVVADQVVLSQTTRLLGRTVRESTETFLTRDVLVVGFERRFPHLVLLGGALGMLLGAIVGVGWVIDGIQASYVPIAVFGLGVLAAGVGLDIAFGALADHIGPKTGLLMTLRTTRGFQLFATRFRIEGVDENGARRLLRLLAR